MTNPSAYPASRINRPRRSASASKSDASRASRCNDTTAPAATVAESKSSPSDDDFNAPRCPCCAAPTLPNDRLCSAHRVIADEAQRLLDAVRQHRPEERTRERRPRSAQDARGASLVESRDRNTTDASREPQRSETAITAPKPGAERTAR